MDEYIGTFIWSNKRSILQLCCLSFNKIEQVMNYKVIHFSMVFFNANDPLPNDDRRKTNGYDAQATINSGKHAPHIQYHNA